MAARLKNGTVVKVATEFGPAKGVIIGWDNEHNEYDIAMFDRDVVDWPTWWTEPNKFKALKAAPWTIKKSRRKDGHTFYFLYSPKGKWMIAAGCRHFTSFVEARDHWHDRDRSFAEDNEALNAWSLKFVDRAEKIIKKLRAAKR